MIEMNNNDSKKKLIRKFKRVVNSVLVAGLLLPNIASVGVVHAEETQPEVPATDPIEAQEGTTEEAQTSDVAPAQAVVPREVRVQILVGTPNNMQNYTNTLEDLTNHPLILTNRVNGETFTTNIAPSDGNTSNNFTLEANVMAYERGNDPTNIYDITLPQELIDLGYSLTRDHSVTSNFGIVGTTTLSYNAPKSNENVGELARNIQDYGYLEGRALQIILEAVDGSGTYNLGSRNLSLPSGEYTVHIANSPEETRPSLVLRGSSLVNAPETEVPLVKSGDEYVGTLTLDFTNSTRPQVLKISPTDLEVSHIVTIDSNGGTIDPAYETTEVNIGETFTVPYGFQSNLAREGYTLTSYTVEGTLLDSSGNAVAEIERFSRNYTPETDVTLTANWELTSGKFTLRDSIPNFITDSRTYALTDGENTYELTSNSYGSNYRTWEVEDVPNGIYTLLVDGVEYPEEWNFRKVGHPDTTSDYNINEEGVVTFDLTFEDDDVSTFIRYELAMNSYPIGIEIRDSDNVRTSEVEITVSNEEGDMFTGSYNQYNQWLTEESLLPGTYTITLDTPEGTVAVINDTVASQNAVATDIENVFTISVNRETIGSLSAVYGAFRLVDDARTDAERYTPELADAARVTLSNGRRKNLHKANINGLLNGITKGNGQNKLPKVESLVENAEDLPEGTMFEYGEVSTSGSVEDVTAEVIVNYPDGSSNVYELPVVFE